MHYLGFAAPAPAPDPLGRRLVGTRFPDPVAPESVGSAAGRTSTVFLDELGRSRRTEVALGADYAGETLIVGARTYDGLGRVTFAADPYPASQDAATAYGTTYHFKSDGWPDCFIRGRGPQPLIAVTDEATERYPTCFDRFHHDHQEHVGVRDAASLLAGSPQAGVVQSASMTAIGRVIARSTWSPTAGNDPFSGTRLQHATFTHNPLGQRTGMTRFADAAGGTDPVAWSWRFDSLGQLLQSQEPESAPQVTTYSDWGQPLEVQWTDSTSTPAVDRRVVHTYDALGRLVHREEQTNQVVDAATVHDFIYDQAVHSTTPPVTATHVLGRLAKATSPTSSVSFSYDAFGRINAQIFTDRTTPSANVYVQKHTFHGDGSLQALDFLLPDTTPAKEERVD
jgi:YD repeat-containing protein